MNSLYLLIHTGVVFFLGSGSEFATNPVYAFAVDIIVMGTAASFIYYSIFQKTGGNVLYVLLIGTVLTTFFSSMQNRSPASWIRMNTMRSSIRSWQALLT